MEVEKPALEHVATDMHHPSLGNHRLTADQTAVRAFLTTLASMKDWDQSPSDQRMAVISQQQHSGRPCPATAQSSGLCAEGKRLQTQIQMHTIDDWWKELLLLLHCEQHRASCPCKASKQMVQSYESSTSSTLI